MTQLPELFVERMRRLLGEEYEAFAASYDRERVQGLRFNSLKTREGRTEGWEGSPEAAALAHRIAAEMGITLQRIPWVKEGFYFRNPAGTARPGKHPYHEAGLYYIQEPSAMAVAELLDPQPGEMILDLCAAPGGKSSHIASRLKGRGFLLSNEIHPARARILSQNMERMGASNVVVSNESSERLADCFPLFFDRIVVDAPCSGEGMFRKDEEARNQWSEEHVKLCAARQAGILDNAAVMLRPGGLLVYSTCTFAPEENEETIAQFLMRHEEFTLEEGTHCQGFSGGRSDWVSREEEGQEKQGKGQEQALHLERTIRMMPHKLEGEGHFIAILKKAGERGDNPKRKAPAYLNKSKEKQIWSGLEAFLWETLKNPEEFLDRKEYILFAEQLYLLPPQMPDMRGLRIIRPGLHMGTIKKNRLEPSHALALSLLPGQAAASYDLPTDCPEVLRYLKGEALPCDFSRLRGKDKGWVLVCTGGVSLGWCKLAGGILKNHYPKGLRWV